PLIAESLLVVGTDGTSADTTIGAVWALERATGQVRWRPRVRRWERRRRLRAGSGLGTSPVATQRRIGDQHGPPGPRVATVSGDRTWPAGAPEPGDRRARGRAAGRRHVHGSAGAGRGFAGRPARRTIGGVRRAHDRAPDLDPGPAGEGQLAAALPLAGPGHRGHRAR